MNINRHVDMKILHESREGWMVVQHDELIYLLDSQKNVMSTYDPENRPTGMYFDHVAAHALDYDPVDVLVVGAAGMTVVRRMMDMSEVDLNFTTIERNKGIAEIAREYFHTLELDVTERVVSAEVFFAEEGDKEKYDVVISDVFDYKGGVDGDCCNEDYIADVHRVLRPNGAVILNYSSEKLYRAMQPILDQYFVGEVAEWISPRNYLVVCVKG